MPPGRATGGSEPPPAAGGVDFRASDDDAWYGVRLGVALGDGGGGGEHFLRVTYYNLPGVWDERFASGGFADEVELEEFSRRFRASSVQLQDGECGGVVEGMTVCASYVFAEEDVRFYDAVVEEVCYSDHKIVDGVEVCTCNFVLLWQHGPNAGRKTSTGIEHICLIKQKSKQVDPALDLFLELSRKSIQSAGQTSCKGQPSSKPEEHNKIKVVHAGSKEYSRAKKLQELYIEFRNHVQGLHKRLALEERELLQY